MDTAKRLGELAISRSGFVFDPRTGITFTVNGTGRFILSALQADTPVDKIVESLGRSYAMGAGDDPARDVRELLAELRDQGILPREEETR